MAKDIYDSFRRPTRSWAKFCNLIDWTGLSVLDVGCHAGWFLFAAQKAGADRLIGVDLNGHHNIRSGETPDEKPFDRIRAAGGQSFELIEGDWLKLDARPKADVVLCMNALNYMPNHQEAQRRCFESAGSWVVFETRVPTIPLPGGWGTKLVVNSHWNHRQIRVYYKQED